MGQAAAQGALGEHAAALALEREQLTRMTGVLAPSSSWLRWLNAPDTTMIGPLVASAERAARALGAALLEGHATPVRIDVPVEHHAFAAWAQSAGLVPQPPAPLMVRGADAAPGRRAELWALASQETG